MSIESAADRAAFFSTDDFGVEATWSGGGTVLGIFDAAYMDPLGAFEGTGPAFTAALSDDFAPAQGETLTIDGTVYTIVEVRPDGTGVVAVRLRT